MHMCSMHLFNAPVIVVVVVLVTVLQQCTYPFIHFVHMYVCRVQVELQQRHVHQLTQDENGRHHWHPPGL